ncbi:MAG TPA: PIG-L family deacetylase [Baekduia sp.]|nr:PIG-L family deacetylase [Baekduia sp.]
MSRIVAVAPTLSDAVHSVGATLARHAADGHPVVVVCVFSRDGDPDDEVAAEALGIAGVVHLAADPAGLRGYAEGPESHDGLRADDDIVRTTAAVLAIAMGRLEPDLVLAPLGLTGHVDHVAVERALDELELPRLRWLDLPYALARTPGAPLGAGEIVAVPADDAPLAAKLAAAAAYGSDVDRLAAHAVAEGERLGAGGPVELLVRR